ncbi:2-dehydro-3-deoxy-6-phosphogalactonate aldolase [Catenovulum agarivorans DS-2]|uniref:2-dehydro-3-deoxy-6-phosphogalactonate aldolase n=1 Tax=Catenovulum agarivorans DS-2 TaxID=1328313 RepID=W7QBP6_9ALTE|nr:2-dehydro-3-deoxy-6-phosphogalactonate aldolase [Catenovulum agarivorans]EWH10254.1 2-dehydro-3-deoxy-6-phosphogalactonate aldolase [Catenovulum agarivorans DS-2]
MPSSSFNVNNHLPLIAIIRGVQPDNVLEVAEVLVDAGFSLIEVPLNSPDALTSIKLLVEKYQAELGKSIYVGAGTVTTPAQAQAVIDTGANLVVTPNLNLEVLELAHQANCITFPGVVTPTEAFSAVAAGATGIKLFPISMVGLDGYKALKSVLPKDVLSFPVGGVEPTVDSMLPYLKIGANGFGLGSALYKADMSIEQISDIAKAFVKAYEQCLQQI